MEYKMWKNKNGIILLNKLIKIMMDKLVSNSSSIVWPKYLKYVLISLVQLDRVRNLKK